MRFVVAVAILGSLLLAFRLPRLEAAQPAVTVQEGRAARMMLFQVERAAMLRDRSACDALSPMPLYVGSPSPEDWAAFCTAVVNRDPAQCKNISPMILPALSSICSSLF